MYQQSLTRRRGQQKPSEKQILLQSTTLLQEPSSVLSIPSQQTISTVNEATSYSTSRSVTPTYNRIINPISTNDKFSAANIEDMPCRDRTSEFKATVKSMQMKVQANGVGSRKSAKQNMQYSLQFSRLAKTIGHDLSDTCTKLEKLADLAKKRSLFDDRITEIDELTHVIKQDIGSLNQQIAQLQQFANTHQLGSASNSQPQNHSKSVVVSLQSKLASVSNDFKQVLELRTENLKHQKTRRAQFSHSQPIPAGLPPSASKGQMGSVLLADERAAQNGDVAISMDSVERDRYQQQMLLIDEQDTYIQSRANTMQSIESTIVELGSIFQQLAHMVQEQGEMVQRIDSNVEETSLNIEAAHMELLKYFRSISQNRWLALKVFGVLVVFFVIFIVFLV